MHEALYQTTMEEGRPFSFSINLGIFNVMSTIYVNQFMAYQEHDNLLC